MKAQATKFGAEARNGIIVDVSKEPAGHFRVELSDGDVYTADAFIAASGASARTLGVPGEDELMGYGLSTCATCDGAFFRDEDMLVVGGGDADDGGELPDEVRGHRLHRPPPRGVPRRGRVDRAHDGEGRGRRDRAPPQHRTHRDPRHARGRDRPRHPRRAPGRASHGEARRSGDRRRGRRVRFRRGAPSSLPSATHRTRTSWRGPRSRPTTRGTCSPRAAAAGTRPRPASRGCSARATWSISTTSRPSPRPGWGVRPRSTPTSTSPSASAPVSTRATADDAATADD